MCRTPYTCRGGDQAFSVGHSTAESPGPPRINLFLTVFLPDILTLTVDLLASSPSLKGEPMSSERQMEHIQVFTLWSVEVLYKLCIDAANKICQRFKVPGEREDTIQFLWLYLVNKGHTIKQPQQKGAICKFLMLRAKKYLLRKLKADRLNFSIDDDDEELMRLPDTNPALDPYGQFRAEEILQGIDQDIRADQNGLRIKMVRELWDDGLLQIEIAQRLGIAQSQVSKALGKYKAYARLRFEL